MTHEMPLISTIAAAFGVAIVFGYVAARLKMPPLVGYLFAGMLIGPNTPGFVADAALAAQLAEVGVMLLLFGVGLHFSFAELMEVRRVALPGAVVQIPLVALVGGVTAAAWGWSFGAALVFGLSLSVASTVVLLRSLESRRLLKSFEGRIAIGWLIVQDVVMVLVLVVLPPLASVLTGDGGAVDAGELARALGVTLLKVGGFILVMFVAGRRLLPRLLWVVAKTGSRELFTLAVIAAAVGVAYGSAQLFGVSLALGAFFAGMMMRESALSHRAAEESLPLQDAFAVLFFVSVGMLFDASVLVRAPLAVAMTTAIIIIVNPVVAAAIIILLRYPLGTAFTVGAGLGQIGEFSFILSGLGLSLGLITREVHSLILASALISIAINPLLLAASVPLEGWVRRKWYLFARFERPRDPLAELPMSIDQSVLTAHVVLVGFGRVGRRIADALAKERITHVVVEQNREFVESLRARNVPAVSGDASDPAVLIQAHVARAKMLVIATPDALHLRRMVEIARMLNPRIDIVLRTHSDDEATLLREEEAGEVFMGEHELATGMSRFVLERMKSNSAVRERVI